MNRVSRRDLVSELARASSGGLISVKRAAETLGVSSHDAAVQLAGLARAGWLARAKRGLYLVLPLEASARVAPVAEDAWLLAQELFAPCSIGGWTAAEHWGLTEQVFHSTFVVTAAARRTQRETGLSTEFHVVRVRPTRMTGISTVWRGTARVAVSGRERTIADALVHPRVGGVRHLAELLVTYRESKEFDPAKLVRRLDELDVGAGFKRMGYLAEQPWRHSHEVATSALRKEVCCKKRRAPDLCIADRDGSELRRASRGLGALPARTDSSSSLHTAASAASRSRTRFDARARAICSSMRGSKGVGRSSRSRLLRCRTCA